MYIAVLLNNQVKVAAVRHIAVLLNNWVKVSAVKHIAVLLNNRVKVAAVKHIAVVSNKVSQSCCNKTHCCVITDYGVTVKSGKNFLLKAHLYDLTILDSYLLLCLCLCSLKLIHFPQILQGYC